MRCRVSCCNAQGFQGSPTGSANWAKPAGSTTWSTIIRELRRRPYDLTLVPGGNALRTKTRFAPAIRAAHPGLGGDIAERTRTETFALTAIAYLQPVTWGEISKLARREISREVIAALQAPRPGAPFAYVTTRKFLNAFGFASLRDIERLKADGLMQTGQGG